MKIKLLVIVLLILSLGGAALIEGSLSHVLTTTNNGASGSTSTIDVNLDNPQHTVPPLLFGSNIQWTASGDGLLSYKKNQPHFDKDVMNYIKESGTSCMRFPGGALANTYRWKSGIGPYQKRKPGMDFAKKMVQSRFGTDEFIALCQTSDLEGMITVNLQAGAAEAADWVEYVNGSVETEFGKLRAQNGYPEPLNVKFWEIGNELYSPDQPGHSTATEYGHQVKEFSQTMKAKDPSIKIGVVLESCFQQAVWLKAAFPHMVTWNEEVLKVAGQHVDFLIVHFYAPFETVLSEDYLHKLVWAGPIAFEQTLADIAQLKAKYCRPHTTVAVTEYGNYFGGTKKLDPRIGSTENGLFLALFLASMMRDPEIEVANHWSLVNNPFFGVAQTYNIQGVRQPFKLRSSATVFKFLASYANGRVLPLNLKSDSYSVKAKGNIPHLNAVSHLDAIAVNSEKNQFKMMVVNRSPSDSANVTVTLQGKKVPPSLKIKTFFATGNEAQWQENPIQTVSTNATGQVTFTAPPYSLSFLIESDDAFPSMK